MGGTGVAEIREPAAIWINPAQLAWLGAPEISFMHGVWVEDVALEQLAVAMPTPFGRFGGALTVLRISDIESFDASGNLTGTFSPLDLSLTGAYAYAFGDLAFGVAGTYLRSKLASDARATAFAGGAGVSFTPQPALTISVAALHLGSALKFDQKAASLPVTIRGGASYLLPAYGVTLAADAIKPRDGDLSVHVGAEERIPLREELSVNVRGGWRSRAPSGGSVSGATAGGGLLWQPVKGFGGSRRVREFGEERSHPVRAIRLDYAWTPMGELGAAHWFSVALIF